MYICINIFQSALDNLIVFLKKLGGIPFCVNPNSCQGATEKMSIHLFLNKADNNQVSLYNLHALNHAKLSTQWNNDTMESIHITAGHLKNVFPNK